MRATLLICLCLMVASAAIPMVAASSIDETPLPSGIDVPLEPTVIDLENCYIVYGNHSYTLYDLLAYFESPTNEVLETEIEVLTQKLEAEQALRADLAVQIYNMQQYNFYFQWASMAVVILLAAALILVDYRRRNPR